MGPPSRGPDALTEAEADLIRRTCAALGLGWDAGHREKLGHFKAELLRWNRRASLFSQGDESRLVEAHFVDSMRPLPYLPAGSDRRILDLGSGAGFPGLVIKILRPDLQMVLLDSSRKKGAFRAHVIRVLGLSGIVSLVSRAEDLARDCEFSRAFDAVLARAAGELGLVVSLAAPFLGPGGMVLTYKQSDPSGEISDSLPIASSLGFEPPQVAEEALLGRGRGCLVLVRRSGLLPTAG